MQQLRILTAGELLGLCCPVLYKPSPYCRQQFSSTSLWPLFVFGQENIQADARTYFFITKDDNCHNLTLLTLSVHVKAPSDFGVTINGTLALGYSL